MIENCSICTFFKRSYPASRLGRCSIGTSIDGEFEFGDWKTCTAFEMVADCSKCKQLNNRIEELELELRNQKDCYSKMVQSFLGFSYPK